MKILKSFYLVFLCILLFITIFIFQSSFALKNTVFAPDRYQKILASDEAYKAFINVATANTTPEIKQMVAESVDKNFYNKMSADLVKGIFDFLDEKTSKLPVIDITALNDKAIETALNKELAKRGPIAANLDKNLIKAEVQKEINLPTKIDLNEITKNNMDLANNNLDKEVKMVYKSFQALPTLAILIMLFIILAVIVVTVSPINILRWLGTTSLITGLFTLLSSQAITQNLFGNNFNELVTLMFTKLINQYRSIFTSETYIFIGIGLLLLALSFIPALKEKSLKLIEQMHNSPKYKAIKVSRLIATLILTILIPVTLYIYSIPAINAASDTGKGTINTNKTK